MRLLLLPVLLPPLLLLSLLLIFLLLLFVLMLVLRLGAWWWQRAPSSYSRSGRVICLALVWWFSSWLLP